MSLINQISERYDYQRSQTELTPGEEWQIEKVARVRQHEYAPNTYLSEQWNALDHPIEHPLLAQNDLRLIIPQHRQIHQPFQFESENVDESGVRAYETETNFFKKQKHHRTIPELISLYFSDVPEVIRYSNGDVTPIVSVAQAIFNDIRSAQCYKLAQVAVNYHPTLAGIAGIVMQYRESFHVRAVMPEIERQLQSLYQLERQKMGDYKSMYMKYIYGYEDSLSQMSNAETAFVDNRNLLVKSIYRAVLSNTADMLRSEALVLYFMLPFPNDDAELTPQYDRIKTILRDYMLSADKRKVYLAEAKIQEIAEAVDSIDYTQMDQTQLLEQLTRLEKMRALILKRNQEHANAMTQLEQITKLSSVDREIENIKALLYQSTEGSEALVNLIDTFSIDSAFSTGDPVQSVGDYIAQVNDRLNEIPTFIGDQPSYLLIRLNAQQDAVQKYSLSHVDQDAFAGILLSFSTAMETIRAKPSHVTYLSSSQIEDRVNNIESAHVVKDTFEFDELYKNCMKYSMDVALKNDLFYESDLTDRNALVGNIFKAYDKSPEKRKELLDAIQFFGLLPLAEDRGAYTPMSSQPVKSIYDALPESFQESFKDGYPTHKTLYPRFLPAPYDDDFKDVYTAAGIAAFHSMLPDVIPQTVVNGDHIEMKLFFTVLIQNFMQNYLEDLKYHTFIGTIVKLVNRAYAQERITNTSIQSVDFGDLNVYERNVNEFFSYSLGRENHPSRKIFALPALIPKGSYNVPTPVMVAAYCNLDRDQMRTYLEKIPSSSDQYLANLLYVFLRSQSLDVVKTFLGYQIPEYYRRYHNKTDVEMKFTEQFDQSFIKISEGNLMSEKPMELDEPKRFTLTMDLDDEVKGQEIPASGDTSMALDE